MGGSYPSAEVQSVYSTAPADEAICHKNKSKTRSLAQNEMQTVSSRIEYKLPSFFIRH